MSLAVSFIELYKDSRTLDVGNDSITRTFVLILKGEFWDEADEMDFYDKADDEKVYEWLLSNIPWFMSFRVGPYIAILMLSGVAIKQEADDVWRADISYDLPEDASSTLQQDDLNTLINEYNLGVKEDEDDDTKWADEYCELSFNSTVEKVHTNTSLKLLEIQKAKWLPAGINPPAGLIVDQPCPIGLTDKEIKGGDRYEEVCTFQITQYFQPKKLTWKYLRTLRLLAGRVNDRKWFGFPMGSVLFKGHQAQGKIIQNIPVTFEFEVKNNFKFLESGIDASADPNETDTKEMYDFIGNTFFEDTTRAMSNPDEGAYPAGVHSGHVLVDYLYIPIPDDDAKMRVMKPAFRLIHQMQRFGDFKRILRL